jgi:hypothetical protein
MNPEICGAISRDQGPRFPAPSGPTLEDQGGLWLIFIFNNKINWLAIFFRDNFLSLRKTLKNPASGRFSKNVGPGSRSRKAPNPTVYALQPIELINLSLNLARAAPLLCFVTNL